MINLREIRTTAGISQADLGERLGYAPRNSQRGVSQLEAREDWLLSSLTAYIKAVGATAELIVTVDGKEVRFNVV